jgi:hypothetical protein
MKLTQFLVGGNRRWAQMGSRIELNDTLQITSEQGFPAHILDLARHQATPIPLSEVSGQVFRFVGKTGARFFQADPVRVYFVHNVNGKWLFWGKVFIQSQTIEKLLNPDGSWTEGQWVTTGTFRIVDIYEPVYQEMFTKREAPPGKSYF